MSPLRLFKESAKRYDRRIINTGNLNIQHLLEHSPFSYKNSKLTVRILVKKSKKLWWKDKPINRWYDRIPSLLIIYPQVGVRRLVREDIISCPHFLSSPDLLFSISCDHRHEREQMPVMKHKKEKERIRDVEVIDSPVDIRPKGKTEDN